MANHDDAPVGSSQRIYGNIGRKEGERESESLFHLSQNIERVDMKMHTIELYQSPIDAIKTGKLFSSGVSLKCLSIPCAPLRSCSKLSYPMTRAIDNPIAFQRLHRPPTQPRNWNIFMLSATKCVATCALSLADARNQLQVVSAFVIVPCVVRALLAIVNSVVSAYLGRFRDMGPINIRHGMCR